MSIAGVSWALDLIGSIAHVAWESGRLWPDLECECGDGPGDDGDDDPEPGEPEDDGGLTAEIESWLSTQPTNRI